MPEYEAIEFTRHALERMLERHITEGDVRHVLRFGEKRPGKRGMWLVEMWPTTTSGVRVVVREIGISARVITVIPLRRRS